MKFCRNCGSALATTGAPPPLVAPPMPIGMPPGPIASPPAASPRGAMAMPPPGPFITPPPTVPSGPMPGPMPGAMPPIAAPPHAPTSYPAPPIPAAPAPAPQGSTITCPRCGTQTPLGFAYCQQCGLHMQAVQPTDPAASVRPRPLSAPPPVAPGPSIRPSSQQPPIDPQAATMAADHVRAGSIANPNAPAPVTAAGSAWGSAVLVNRDGSDGQRFPLAGEYLVVGRTGADIEFADDRFLARQHARLERAADGSVKVHPLDTLNGVFRKTDAPVELAEGSTILVGREVLRYERVDAEEQKVHPLVRHGVALFGSPPREPWGRLLQIVPSGGYRDVRHLAGDEVVLGREEGDIVFRDDAFMSRRHAAITWDGKRAQVTDLGSSNGTFVRITGPATLKHGDHVRMGDQLMRIELVR